MAFERLNLAQRPALAARAAAWFHEKWGVPPEAYRESMAAALEGPGPVPQWYLAVEDGRIIGGMGVIENDFHDRKDLAPNVCADMSARGVDTLYLLTDHDSFYERYGWRFLCMAQGDGEAEPSRLYVHRMGDEEK